MYGLIGQLRAQPGQREALAELLLGNLGEMAGCRSYIIGLDETDTDAIWITEVWDDKASHDASLALPAVRSLIEQARPLIAGFGASYVTRPLGGLF